MQEADARYGDVQYGEVQYGSVVDRNYAGWNLRLELDSGEIGRVFTPAIVSGTAQPEISAVGAWNLRIQQSDTVADFNRAEAYLYYRDTLIMRGEQILTRSANDTPTTVVEGEDIIKRLKQGGTSRLFENVEAFEAAETYVTEETDFTANVTAPTAQMIEMDKVVQEADTTAEFEALYSPPATQPLTTANDSLALQQSAWFRNETDSTAGNFGPFSEAGFEAGGGLSATSGFNEWEIDVDYTIPEENVGVRFRQEVEGTDASIDYTLNGDTMVSDFEVSAQTDPSWTNDIADGLGGFGNGYTGGDLTPGTYTVRIDVSNTGSDAVKVDCLSVYDNRYNYDFDETLDGNDSLSGPQEYPDQIDVVFAEHDDQFNIAQADVTSTWNDVSNAQRIQLSLDSGTTYYPQDGSEDNTQTVSVDFGALEVLGTNITPRIRLSRYGTQTESPTEGILGQEIQSWELAIDTNNIRVIDSQRFTGSDFQNLEAICDIGGLIFVPDYREGELVLDVFQRGDVSQPLPYSSFEVLNSEFVDTTEDYANQITVFGADSGDGTPLEATVTSQSEVTRVGATVPGVPIFDPSLKTQEAVDGAAAQALQERIANDRITGQVTIKPKNIQPGYTYTVPELDGEEAVLDNTTINIGAEEQTLDFEGLLDVAQAFNEQNTEIQRTKRSF